MGSFIKRLALSPAVGGKKSVITELFAVVGRGRGERENRAGGGGRSGGGGGPGRIEAPNPSDLAMPKNLCLHTLLSVVLWWLGKAKGWE